jgi:hypothetical protein
LTFVNDKSQTITTIFVHFDKNKKEIYATGLLTKHAGIDTTDKNFQYYHAFTDAMCGIGDKIVVADAFDKTQIVYMEYGNP